ncbi:MAG: amidohydrolase family protein [Erysipelotrichaceae bacterium]|nr:amidohydrolase family protein [Erysipelotrichaceae bacterium]
MIIRNANVFRNGRFEQADVLFNDDQILKVERNIDAGGHQVIDAQGADLYAGIIDCHIHGGFLRSFQANVKKETWEKYGDPETQARYICKKVVENGVTSVMPTIGDLTVEEYQEAVRLIRRIRRDIEGADPFMFHFEGAYQNPEHHSSFNHDHDTLPSREHTLAICGNDLSDVCLIGIAPELEGSMEYLEWLCSKTKVHAEAGYTKASADTIRKAADLGLDQTTHMFNGFEYMHHRIEGPDVGIMVDDRIKCQLTLDSYHVSPSWCKLLIKIKGIDKIYGLTDLSSHSGLPEGVHHLEDGRTIIAADGFIKDEKGTIQSGNNTMDQIMYKARHLVGLSKEEVGQIFTENVAGCLGIKDRGRIEAGRRSDFVLMDDDYHVLKTIIGGRVAYERK